MIKNIIRTFIKECICSHTYLKFRINNIKIFRSRSQYGMPVGASVEVEAFCQDCGMKWIQICETEYLSGLDDNHIFVE